MTRGTGWNTLGEVAALLGVFVVGAICLFRVAFLFLFVTVEGEFLWLFRAADRIRPWLPAQLGFALESPYWFAIVFIVLTVPALVLATLRAYRRGGWPRALFVVGACGVTLLVGASYRLPGLLAIIPLAVVLPRTLSSHRPERGGWVLLAVSIALCCAPADVSLRVRPGPSRFVRAAPCGLSPSAWDADARGDLVCVGGHTDLYNWPRWVWVW